MLFDAGRMHYQAGEMAAARAEFDRAIEVLLNAHDNSANRQVFERKLSELIEEIYRFDLSGLGASDVSSEPRFETNTTGS